MKAYPVTEEDLNSLGWMDAWAALLFAVGSAAGTMWFDITKDLSLATGIPLEAKAFYSGVRAACGIIAVVAVLAGVIAYVRRNSKVRKIIDRTTFT